MANPTGGWIWYELMTIEPDAATLFYVEVVGWTIAGHADPQAGGVDYRHIRRSDGGSLGGMLGLSKEMIDHGARPGWVGYIHVADVDATVKAIAADGGKLLMPAFDLAVGRIAMVADPQDAPFYVMKPIPPEGEPDAVSDVFSPDKPQHIRWNELMSSDPDASIAFYTKHFGWTQEGEMDMGQIGKYRFIQHNGVGIGAVMPKMPQMPYSAWNHYIGVDDIDRAVEAVQSGGGQIVNGPHEIPGGEFSMNGIDPQGALFGLVGPRKR